jgi:N-acetylglucosaminyl-diphospho-decaprenol L-rhamnosyltransferase
MRVTVIIVNFNTAHLLPPMFAALDAATGDLDLQCIIIDNASRDASVELIRRDYPQHHLIVNPVNVGFGRANNQALPFVEGRYVLLLNTDAFVAPDTLRKTIEYLEANPRCGVLGVRLVGRDGTMQPCCRYSPTPLNSFLRRTGMEKIFPSVAMADDLNWDHASVRRCDWVPGCYYLVRKETIDQVGLFDPRYFLYFEEVDHCRAVKRAGWDVVFYPDTTVVHIGGESARSEATLTEAGRQIDVLQIESELLYFRKNYGRIGVWADVLLGNLGEAIVLAKQCLRGRWQISPALARVALLWKVFWRTGFGLHPTR